MVGRIDGPSHIHAAADNPPLQPSQQQQLYHYVSTLWTVTYAADQSDKSPYPSQPPSQTQLMMIAQAIYNLVNFVKTCGSVTLDSYTAQLMADLNSGGSSSLATAAASLSPGFNNYNTTFHDFVNAYDVNGTAVGTDTHKWFKDGPGDNITYTPNSTSSNPGSSTASTANLEKFESDLSLLLQALRDYMANPSNIYSANSLADYITWVNADLNVTKLPPELDPYEMAVYQMLNTPWPESTKGSTLVEMAASSVTSQDFTNIGKFFNSNGENYSKMLWMIINDSTGY